MKKVTNINEFIEKARKVHGDRYDYSKVNYVNSKTKVCIICTEHGEFWQKPNDHLQGKGCKYCGIESRTQKKTLPNKTFIERACKIHNNFYSYDKITEYKGCDCKYIITCPIHGDFTQTFYYHINKKQGCPLCGIERAKKKRVAKDYISF